MIRNKKIAELHTKYGTVFFDYKNFKDDSIEQKCLCGRTNYQQMFDQKLNEGFFNTQKFSSHDNNNFILLLQKGLYPYEYLFHWEKFIEISFPEKEDFCSHLTTEYITDADYVHEERVCKVFEIKYIGGYHNLFFSKRYLLVCLLIFHCCL